MNAHIDSTAYAELHCLSHFSFGRGASSARELFEQASKQGYRALAITDECSFSGVVRALEASRETGLPLIVGTEVTLVDGLKLVLLAQTRQGYSAISRLITRGRRSADKGSYRLDRGDFSEGLPDTLVLWLPAATPDREQGEWLRGLFAGRLWLAVELHRQCDDQRRLQKLLALAQDLGLPAVAAGDVHMHVRRRRSVQDTLTAIRHRCTVAEAGAHLFPNGERHLRSRRALTAIYPEELLQESARIAALCSFDLGELKYQYPRELVPDDQTPTTWLARLTRAGCAQRWPQGVPAEVAMQIERELALIAELKYEAFFLTVEDVVRFARSRGILCQGRGSAANSAVCYALGITEVNPALMNMLFERFISRERNEPPDIDVDFEHERREEVIQYIFSKYGRERAALAATVICYRGKSAIGDVAKALGLPGDQVERLRQVFSRGNSAAGIDDLLHEEGFDPDSPVLRRVLAVTRELINAPRHLSQHVGGFVISEQPLHHLVPVENAAMPERTIIQWDKDDLETLGLLKVDCLALGMLTCVSKCLALLRHHHGVDLTPAAIPADDAPTYAMIQRADTVGVFQIESRAQMAMLPRLKPKNFYDLVIEVAIVRPGPIQGGMVHPYLRRRQGIDPVRYPSRALQTVLERTLGVPLFQEQVMQIAIVAADYTPGEADELRRSMAAWKRRGGLEHHREKLLSGMARNGYGSDFAEAIFEQVKGFGSYGFPESHAASFALITYVSCWLKQHYPAAFTCALMNSQPLGFYSNDQLMQDVRRHGVEMRPVDVRFSDWDSALELNFPASPVAEAKHAIRLGLRHVTGFTPDAAARIEQARTAQGFLDVEDLCARSGIDSRQQSLLADAGALKGLAGHRHRARWAIQGVEMQLPLFAAVAVRDAPVSLPVPTAAEDSFADYRSLGLTLGRHPLTLIRTQLSALRCRRSAAAKKLAHGTSVCIAGLVIGRQRPQTASGVTFVTLEDEDGMVNVVVWHDLAERQRRVLLESRLLAVEGRLESVDGVQHLIAGRLRDFTPMLSGLVTQSRDFH
ncbi:MAG TPA: error-prone DNA polymerase [Arenimonas sp.]|uniref:error-prone DNA polymerase n=1 Tax=Arenimonas sp. TaxID=1872635 RepID=UPI002C89AEA9|nr:error-prone DNA polymerase [Arenimonas sp.]HMB57471.1 error-prone DNA polymerase [Arenimonas sp.]